MTFAQARAISKTNQMHVRRASWPANQWFMLWRGTWFCFGTGIAIPRPVLATDYSAADLLATDWSTVPAPLTACPVTSTAPNGGNPPVPGTGPWSDDSNLFPPQSGAPSNGSGSTSLPPPDPGTSIRVKFEGIEHGTLAPHIVGVDNNLNGIYTLELDGPSAWSKTFPLGYWARDDGADDHDFTWKIVATKLTDGTGAFHLSIGCLDDPMGGTIPSGGFGEVHPERRGVLMTNTYVAGVGLNFYNGTGKIL